MAMLNHKDKFDQSLVYGSNAFALGFSRRRVVQLELLNDAHSIVLVPRVKFNANVGKTFFLFHAFNFPFW